MKTSISPPSSLQILMSMDALVASGLLSTVPLVGLQAPLLPNTAKLVLPLFNRTATRRLVAGTAT